MVVLVPISFKLPTNLEQFDGFTNPQEHLKGFKATILHFGALDAIICHAFFSTFKKIGL